MIPLDTGSRRVRRAFRRHGTLLVFVLLVGTSLVVFRAVLLPFLLALFLSYLLAPLIGRLQGVSIRGRSPARWGAVVILYLILLGVASLLAFTVVPALFAEVAKLAETLPILVQAAKERWLPEASHFLDQLLARTFGSPNVSPSFNLEEEVRQSLTVWIESASAHAGDALLWGRTLLQGILHGLTATVLTLMITAFLLVDAPLLLGYVRSLVSAESQPGWDELVGAIDKGLAGVIRGQLIICVINGLLTWIGLMIFSVPFSLVLALLAGVCSLIPIFGTIVSSVPVVLMGLTVSPLTGLLILVWILLIHALEANLLNPKILGSQAHIHPVVVVFSLLAGEHAFGLLGALLAVPVVSVVQTLFLHFQKVMTRELGPPTAEVPALSRPSSSRVER